MYILSRGTLGEQSAVLETFVCFLIVKMLCAQLLCYVSDPRDVHVIGPSDVLVLHSS